MTFCGRQGLVLATTILSGSLPALADEDARLGIIYLEEEIDWGALAPLTMDREDTDTFGDTSGDVNEAIATLPNVQNETQRTVGGVSDNGVSSDSMLDLQPSKLSISGAAVTENNIMINGIGINSIVAAEPFAVGSLDKNTGSTGIDTIYGLHPQTQYVPEAFIDGVEVQTSNVSARYGGFQGGVVNYLLREPNGESRGLLTFGFSSDDLTTYNLETESGTNPLNRAKPEWTRKEVGVEYETPLTDTTSVLLSFSRNTAWGRKPIGHQYIGDRVESESSSDFGRVVLRHELQDGGVFKLSGAATEYEQEWQSNYSYGYQLDTKTSGRTLSGEYTNIFGAWDLSARLTYSRNKVANDSNVDYYANWIGRNTDDTLYDGALDWCNVSPLTTGYVSCMEGGFTGNKRYDDKTLHADLDLSRDLAGGRLNFGASVIKSQAKRARLSDTTAYAAFMPNALGICPPGDLFCNADQFWFVRVIYPAYALEVDAMKYETFLEWERSWERFDLRAGLRLDRNDVMDNTDIAPRLSLGYRLSDTVRADLGLNRYYSDDYMAYAIHDKTPRGINETRPVPTMDPVPYDFGEYRYTQQGLKTPYTDEVALGLTAADPWTGGTWRMTLLNRHGRDQFAHSSVPSGGTYPDNVLTNDGWNRYRSATLEYARVWDRPGPRLLDSVGLRVSGVVADRETSSSGYYNASDELNEIDLIWYNDKSYTNEQFDQLTGNYDIPVRAAVEVQTSWDRGRYGLGLGADINFGYEGVRDTDEDETHVNPIYGSRPHSVYEDYRFKTYARLNLSAQARVYSAAGRDVHLKLKVANLLNKSLGGSTDMHPWVEGRSYWLGTEVTW